MSTRSNTQAACTYVKLIIKRFEASMTDEHDENKQSRMKGLTQEQEKEHEHEHEHENEHEQECEHQDTRWLKRVRCSRTRRVFAAREKAGLSYGEHTSARARTHTYACDIQKENGQGIAVERLEPQGKTKD